VNAALTPNTQAILLLTAPLMLGNADAKADLLTPAIYRRLAQHLRELKHQPADLLSAGSGLSLEAFAEIVDPARLRSLLERGFLLSQVVERWKARSIWVVSRADSGYPRRLKARLRDDAPAVLYGCGDGRLLDEGGLAVVGSRDAGDALAGYAAETGRAAAGARRALISGGAKGIDQAAMQGASDAGGTVIGVLADSLERISMGRDLRTPIMEGRTVLLSPYDPSTSFNVGHAMQRNKLIYALADAALVVSSDVGKGGTWAGAAEQLDRLRFVPVYVRASGEPSAGLTALVDKGARPWLAMPGPKTVETLFEAPVAAAAEPAVVPEAEMPGASTDDPATKLFSVVRETVAVMLAAPKKETAIAAELDISRTQAKAWLQRLVREGFLSKQKNGNFQLARERNLL